MGRIYLPAEDLERFKIGPADFRQSAIPERLRWLLAAEADRAREYYGSARRFDAAHRRGQPARALGPGDDLPPAAGKNLRPQVRRLRQKDQPHRPREGRHPGKGFGKTPGLMTERWTQSPKVAVVGGGLAGLAAGSALAENGFRVTLFERRPYLGGRASSYQHPGTGEVVDNCQHVLLGCCTNLIEFYRRIGVEDKIRWYERMTFLEPGGRASVIQPSASARSAAHGAVVSAGFVPQPDRQVFDRGGSCRPDAHRSARHRRIFSAMVAPPWTNRAGHRSFLEDCPGQRAERGN